MRNILNAARVPRVQNAVRSLVLCLAFTFMLVGSAQAADDHDRDQNWQGNQYEHGHNQGRWAGDRDWNEHEQRSQRYWHHRHFRPAPRVVYAPPVVYYPPQYEEPGFNIIVPLNFR